MLEILLLYWLCSSLGKIIRAKGRKPLLFQILLVVSWICGEIGGFIVGGIVQVVQGGDVEAGGFDLMGYLFALIGAACGAGFWFIVAHLMPDVQPAWHPTGNQTGPYIGPPPDMAPPADPNNPYAPPRTDT